VAQVRSDTIIALSLAAGEGSYVVAIVVASSWVIKHYIGPEKFGSVNT
jgi:hypothetical protein